MNGEKCKHNVVWNTRVKELPYKNHDRKDVSPRKAGADCARLYFLILIGSFYRFQNTPKHVFIVLSCLKTCCQNFSARTKANV